MERCTAVPGSPYTHRLERSQVCQRITPLRFVLHCAQGNRNMITTLSGAIRAGLRCRCPRCGKGKLFAGFLTLRPRCEVCGLDYGFADSGDGPAVFIMCSWPAQSWSVLRW